MPDRPEIPESVVEAAACACGEPSRKGWAHRSHECCRIGYESDKAEARARRAEMALPPDCTPEPDERAMERAFEEAFPGFKWTPTAPMAPESEVAWLETLDWKRAWEAASAVHGDREPALEAERDECAERAWRNGWGSALNAMRAAKDLAERNREITANDWAAAQAVGEMLGTLTDLIGGLTEEFVDSGREVGFAVVPDRTVEREALGPRWAADA